MLQQSLMWDEVEPEGPMVIGAGHAVHAWLPGPTPQGPPDEGRVDFPDVPNLGDLPRVPQQERARAKRDAILKASAVLFAEGGYQATTTPDIAAAAGVSVGTLYSYFRDKRQILLTLVAGTAQTLRALNLDESTSGPDPRGSIRRILADALPYDATHYQLQRAWMSLESGEAELAAYAVEVQRWLYHHVLVAVRRAVGEGNAWPDLDAERTAWTLTVLLDHVWHHQLRPELLTEEEFHLQRDALADFIYHGIFQPSAQRSVGNARFEGKAP